MLEFLGVITMVPLMQFVAGIDPNSGALRTIQDVLGTSSPNVVLSVLAALIVGVFLLKSVASLAFRRWQLRFMAMQEVTLASKVLRGYLTGPYRWHSEDSTGHKVYTMEGATTAGYSAGITSAMSVLTEVMSIAMILVGLAAIDPTITALAVAYFGLGGVLIQRVIRPRLILAGQQSTEFAFATSRNSLEAIGAVKEIKLRQAEDGFVARYASARRRGVIARARAAILSDLPKYVLELMFISMIGIVVLVAAQRSDRAHLLVLMGVFVAAGTRILPSAVRLIGAFSGLRLAYTPLAHVIDTRRQQERADREAKARIKPDAHPSGDVEVRNVRFAYDGAPDVWVLDGVNLNIPSGATVAIVGSSGAGKSTLIDVILGLYEPQGGQVLAGGVDIADNMPYWQRQLAVVPQSVYLMDDTLGANICFEQPMNKALMDDVLAKAQLTDLVAALPEGIDTPTGEQGARLSGGQRQRVGIARALYREPKLLVLDEATSALDNETEHRFTQTVANLRGHVTMVIVAHRLSTVRHCDQLIFMSKGKVAASGTFEEVSAQNAEFANLVRLGSLATHDHPADLM